MTPLAADPTVDAARRYDQWFERGWGRYAWHVERHILRRVVRTAPGLVAVDIGCGSGRSTEILRAQGARVFGIDRDPAMLTIAHQRGTTPLAVADAHALPLLDASVDLALAVTLLEFVADPKAVIAELARVVRPGGRIIIAALNTRSAWGLAHQREFAAPPWDAARFLTRRRLLRLGIRYGRTRITGVLFASGKLPGLRWTGPVLECLGRAAPALGAFQVVVIERS
ncbi:MAG TPA: class I SAM-dependent methyltransferase [Acidimicrobiia bacterium]|nr:class I SAM-dependent methyltransferase [Acidimicrobiia bacterium]